MDYFKIVPWQTSKCYIEEHNPLKDLFVAIDKGELVECINDDIDDVKIDILPYLGVHYRLIEISYMEWKYLKSWFN